MASALLPALLTLLATLLALLPLLALAALLTGLLFLFLAMLLRRSRAVLVPWLLVLGISLLASDVVHHFLILWPILGDPEFSLLDPAVPDPDSSTRLLSWTALVFVLEWSIRIIMLVTVTSTAHRRSTVSALSWLTLWPRNTRRSLITWLTPCP